MNTVTNIGVGLTTAASNQNWSQQAQQVTVLNTSAVNPKFLRGVVLGSSGVYAYRNNVQAGVNMPDLMKAFVSVQPLLTSPANITRQPNDKFLNHGAGASFNIAASGEFEDVVPISFQWQISSDLGSTWNNCNNAVSNVFSAFTTNHLNISNVDPVANYTYRCLTITNAGNNASNSANLEIVQAIANVSVAAPNSTNFTISVYGHGTFSYQWQISTDGGTNYANQNDSGVYSGTTTNVIAISNSTGLNGYKFRCNVNNGTAPLISDNATLTVT